MTEQDYRSEIEYIYTRFPSFQRVGKVAYKPGIQTMQYLDNAMGTPHTSFLSIHVAGTNGKGSTSHMLASALMQLSPREFYEALLQNIPDLAEKYPASAEAMSRNGIGVPRNMMSEKRQGSTGACSAGKSSAISNESGLCADKSGVGGSEEVSSKEVSSKEGYSNAESGKFLKVGLYTSPHLWDFRERIKVSEGNSPNSMKMVEKEYVYNFLKQYRSLFEEQNASFFEITTALAFKYFREQKVDIAIIECGLGGRLDSTNIINPLLSIITNIGLDHCEHLGYEYTQIAAEKAGIIKERVPVIIGELGTEKPSESQPSDWKILVPHKLRPSTFYGSVQLHSQNEQINNKILSAVAGSLFCCAMNDTTSIKKVFIEKAIAMRAPIIFAEYPDRLSLKKSRALSGGFDLSEMDLGGDCQKKNIKAVIIALSRLLNGAKYDCGCWKLARHPLVEYNAALKAKCCELALSKLSNNEVDLNMLAASDSIKPGNIDLLSTYNLLINRDTSSSGIQSGDTSAAGLQGGGPAAQISSGRLQGVDTSESMQNGDTSSTAMQGGDTSSTAMQGGDASSAAMQGGCASSFGMQNGDTSAAMQGGGPTAHISSGRLQGVDTSESMQNGDTSSTAMQGGDASSFGMQGGDASERPGGDTSSSAAMQGGEPAAQISSGRLQNGNTSESMQNGDTSSAAMQGGCASSFGMQNGDTFAAMQGGNTSERPGGDTSSSAGMQGGDTSESMQNGDASSAAMQGGNTSESMQNGDTSSTAMQGGDASSFGMQNGDTSSAAMQGGEPTAQISSGRLQGVDTSESMQNGDTSSAAMQGGPAAQISSGRLQNGNTSESMQNGDTSSERPGGDTSSSAAMQGGEPAAQISSGRLQNGNTSESMQNGDTSSAAMQGGCASSFGMQNGDTFAAMQGGGPTAHISSGRLQGGCASSFGMQNGDTSAAMQGGGPTAHISSGRLQGGCASSFGMQNGDTSATSMQGGDTSESMQNGDTSAAMQGGEPTAQISSGRLQGVDTSESMQNGDTSSAAMQGGPAAQISSGRLQNGNTSESMQNGDTSSERPGGDTSSSAAMQGGCASSFGMQNGDTSAAMQGGPAAQNAGQDYNADHNRNIEQQCNILSDKNVEIILNAAERADNLKQQRFAALIPQLKRGIDNAAHITGLHGRWEHLFVNQTGALTTDPLTNTSKSDSGTEPFIYNVWKNIEIVCDTGHNAHGFSISAPQIIRRVTEQSEKPRRLIMIFGVVADKDLDSIIPILPNHYKKESHTAGFPNEQKNESHIAGFPNEQKNGLQAYYYFVNAAGSRALPAEKLAAKMFANGFKGEIVSPDSPEESSVMKAVDKYLHNGARTGDFLFIGGSSYVVAELKVK